MIFFTGEIERTVRSGESSKLQKNFSPAALLGFSFFESAL